MTLMSIWLGSVLQDNGSQSRILSGTTSCFEVCDVRIFNLDDVDQENIIFGNASCLLGRHSVDAPGHGQVRTMPRCGLEFESHWHGDLA